MRIILDTSVIIAFLLSRGKNYAKEIVRLAKDKTIELVTSKEAVLELKTTLAHESIKKLPHYNPRLIASFIAWYQYHTVCVVLYKRDVPIQLRDKSDVLFLQMAIASGARYIISGDKDLLSLNTIKSTQIITTEQFYLFKKELFEKKKII